MYTITLVVSIILFVIYSFNLTGFSIKGFVLVESCIKDEPIDILFWIVYAVSLLLFIIKPAIGKYMLFAFMLLGFLIFYMNHYRWFFKASEKKISGYNRYFSKTHHIIPASDKRLIPDTYHILLFIMNFICLILTTIGLFAI